jgi:hypothetical protein
MGKLNAILTEIVHLFVDDGSLALLLVGWCAATGLVAHVLAQPSAVCGPMLLLGCAGILLGNVIRAAQLRARAAQTRVDA